MTMTLEEARQYLHDLHEQQRQAQLEADKQKHVSQFREDWNAMQAMVRP